MINREHGERERELTVRLPDHVEKGGTRNEDGPDTHALEIVEAVDEAKWVTTIAELSLPKV